MYQVKYFTNVTLGSPLYSYIGSRSFIQSEDATQSNMAVMEVELPSGFTADLNTIPSLEATENVKLVETKQQATVMIIYFENIGRKELCPTVDAFRTHKVAMQRPAAVTVYDYYDSCKLYILFARSLLQ